MVMNPYRSDTRQLARYGEEDDTNAPDTGAPPRPEPYRPATQQPGSQNRNAQPQRPPTFSQLQDLGEARPPMPPQNPQVSQIQPYRANTVENPAGPNSTGQGLGANPNQPQNQPQSQPQPAPGGAPQMQFGNQAPLAQGAGTLSSYAPQGGVGFFGAGAAGRVFDEAGNPVDVSTLAQGRLTPEAQQRLAQGFSVRLMPGGGASYIANQGTNPAGLQFGQGDGTTTQNAPYLYQPQAPQSPQAPSGTQQVAPPQNILTPEDQEILNGQGGVQPGGGQSPPIIPLNPNTPAPGGTGGSGGGTGSPNGFDPNSGGPSSPNTPAPSNPNAPTGQSPSGGNGFLQDLLPMLFAGANRQNPYGTEQVQDSYNWLGGQIDDQYDVQRQQLGEEMARRGLGASTIYGGRLNDLNIGQRTARENLGYDLTQRQAEGESQAGRDRLDYIRSLIGYGQQGFENDMSTAEFDRRSNNDYEEFIRWLMGQGG